MTVGPGHKLREDGREEDHSLGVGSANYEPVTEDPSAALRGGFDRQRFSQNPATTESLHAEEDEVGSSGDLDDREHGDRTFDDRAETKADRYDLDQLSSLVAQRCRQ